MPRFEPASYAGNLKLLPACQGVAKKAGCTPAQLALGWLLHRGGLSLTHLAEDLAAINVKLSPPVMTKLNALISEKTVTGRRRNAQSQIEVDTKRF